MPEPITPTRIIPPGAPLPVRPAPEPAAPPAPPLTSWPPFAPPAEPREVVHRHVHEFVLVPETPPPPTRWERTRAVLGHFGRPWQALAGLALALIPIPPGHYSLATTWWWCVSQTRHDHGAMAAYSLGLGALVMAATLLTRRPGVIRLALLAVTAIGALGAFALMDPITAITGVS